LQQAATNKKTGNVSEGKTDGIKTSGSILKVPVLSIDIFNKVGYLTGKRMLSSLLIHEKKEKWKVPGFQSQIIDSYAPLRWKVMPM
jgi:hypothetical protein